MKSVLLCLLAFSGVSKAQSSNPPLLDLSGLAVQFDISFANTRTGGSSTIGSFTMYSEAAQLSAKPSCSYALGWGRYMELDIHNRLGMHVGFAYKLYSNSAECENFRLKFFENPRNFIFKFNPLDNSNNREFLVEDANKSP